LAPFAVFDPGLEAGPLGEPPFGANMAFQKKVFARYGGFRADLGRCGANLISNEDTEFGNRLLRAGEMLRYEPLAVVYHPVTKDRLRKNYLLKWWFGKGRADIREFGTPGSSYFLGGVPLYLFRNLAGRSLRWMLELDRRRRFHRKVKVWGKLGEIVECYQGARAAKKIRLL
jgi:GT2 family glycosyltransferase